MVQIPHCTTFEEGILFLRLHFSNHVLVWGQSSSCILTKIAYHNQLNVEPDMEIQLFSMKIDIKEICKKM